MQGWMIGALLGTLWAAFQPTLPSAATQHAATLAGLAALTAPARVRSLSGWLLAYAWSSAQARRTMLRRLPADCVRRDLLVEGRVEGLPRESRFREDVSRQRFEFAVARLLPGECAGPRQLLLSFYGDERIQPGAHYRFTVRLRRPWGLVNPGSFNMQAWYLQSGIDALGSAKAPLRLAGAPLSGSAAHHRLRRDVSRAIESLPLADTSRAVLRAITVADRSGIDAGLWQLFQSYGVSHLLVISGLHVGLVAGLGLVMGGVAQRCMPLAGRPQLELAGPLLACGLATLYAALAGFSIATQRALLMLLVFLVASAAGRPGNGWRSLLIAVATILAVNPAAILGAGLWLSAGAVALLLWWSDWSRSGSRLRTAVSTHGWMCVAMLPVTGWWFGGGSTVAALANMLMVPLVGLWVVPLSLFAILCHAAGAGIAGGLWQLAAVPLEWLHPRADALLEQFSALFYHYYALSLPGGMLAVAALLLLLLPVGARRKLALALVMAVAWVPEGREEGWRARLVVLDVGQGTSVVFQAAGRTLVYDTGGGDPAGRNMASSVVLPFLRQSAVAQVDTLVISHADSDHSAGLATIARALPTAAIVAGEQLPEHFRARSCRAGQAWAWGEQVAFQVLAGGGTGGNDSSCVLKISVAGRDFLLPGDIGAERERELVRFWGPALASDWLLAAHHGSNTSTSAAWLRQVAPREVVLSHGYANPFGHPHRAVMARLAASGAQVESTARSGALEYRILSDGSLVRIRHRDSSRYWWM